MRMCDERIESGREDASGSTPCGRTQDDSADAVSRSANAAVAENAAAVEPDDEPCTCAVATVRARRRYVLLAAAALVAVLFASQTISFMVSSLDMRGRVFFGAVDVRVEETMKDAAGVEVPVPEAAEQIDAERAASRIVRVRNTCDEPVFVRVRLKMTASQVGADGRRASMPADDLALYETGPMWVERDGWWYLPAALAPEELSEPVITGIAFDQAQAQERHPNGTLRFDVVAQCVQAKNNASSSLEAEGWPKGDR